MAKKYLKASNVPIIVVFLVWSVAVFAVADNGLGGFWQSVSDRVTQLSAKDSLFGFLTPLLLVIASGLLPASWKAALVFWRLKDPLPGCRAFSVLATADPRIDQAALVAQIPSKLDSPKEENALWYRWYKDVDDEPTVQEAHRQFLLARDLTAIAFLFFVFGPFGLLSTGTPTSGIILYAVITCLEFLSFSVVARNHGNRFVCNVLVEHQNRVRS